MSPDDLDYLTQFLRRRAGIVVAPHKTSLIESRLAPVARRFGFRHVDSLLRELRYAREGLARAVTEAMTTNDSSFFRDKAVFDHTRDVTLPRLVASRAKEKHLRIWSAACAAGQEPYSLAIILEELKLADKGWSIDLIATDLSSDLIARAEEGIYTEYEIERGLSARRLAAHFTREGKSWRVSDRLKRMVTFRTFNLLDSYGWLHELDAVFCRNVLIYFDQKTKAHVIDKIAEVLAPDGALVLGHSESLDTGDAGFARPDGSVAYHPVGAVLKPVSARPKLTLVSGGRR
jgi:chemotaxis protein methyltransferase CheR